MKVKESKRVWLAILLTMCVFTTAIISYGVTAKAETQTDISDAISMRVDTGFSSDTTRVYVEYSGEDNVFGADGYLEGGKTDDRMPMLDYITVTNIATDVEKTMSEIIAENMASDNPYSGIQFPMASGAQYGPVLLYVRSKALRIMILNEFIAEGNYQVCIKEGFPFADSSYTLAKDVRYGTTNGVWGKDVQKDEVAIDGIFEMYDWGTAWSTDTTQIIITIPETQTLLPSRDIFASGYLNDMATVNASIRNFITVNGKTLNEIIDENKASATPYVGTKFPMDAGPTFNPVVVYFAPHDIQVMILKEYLDQGEFELRIKAGFAYTSADGSTIYTVSEDIIYGYDNSAWTRLYEVTWDLSAGGGTLGLETETYPLGIVPEYKGEGKPSTNTTDYVISWNTAPVEVAGHVTYTASFTEKVRLYDVTLDGEEYQSYEYNQKIVKPTTDPTKASDAEFTYTFDGWYNGDVKWDFDQDTVTENINLTAKYQRTVRKYTVTFDGENGVEYEYGAKITKPATDPTKEADNEYAYTFVGWYNDEIKWDFDAHTVSGNTDLVAVFAPEGIEYTVTFDGENGSEYSYGDKITKPVDPTRDSDVEFTYIFDGWYDDDVKWDFDTHTVSGNVDLISKFTPVTRNYTITVTFEGISDLSDDTKTIAYGESINFTEYAKTGYAYKVYNSAGDEITTFTVSGDAMVRIVYELNTIEIADLFAMYDFGTIWSDDTTQIIITIPENQTLLADRDIFASGYLNDMATVNASIRNFITVNGKTLNEILDGNKASATPYAGTKSPMQSGAVYNPVLVYFAPHDIQVMILKEYLDQGEFELRIKAGFAYTSADGSTVYTVSEDIIYGYYNSAWTRLYEVTWDLSAGGGTLGLETETYPLGIVPEYKGEGKPSTNTTDYVISWNTAPVAVEGNVTYTASFSEKTRLYDVTLDGEEYQSYEYNQKIVKPTTDPTKASDAEFTYTFDGWYNGDVKWDFDQDTVTENINLTAKYQKSVRKYTVTFDGENGVEYEFGSKITKPATDPTKASDNEYTYTFEGWYNGDVKWNFDADVVTGTLNLTAGYMSESRKFTVTVTFEGIDGLTNDTQSLAYGAKVNLTKYAKEGYTYKIYDSNNAEITSLNVSGDCSIKIVYTAIVANEGGCSGFVTTSFGGIGLILLAGVWIMFAKKRSNKKA